MRSGDERMEIDFACNDYRNGDCLGRFEAVNVTWPGGIEYIEFECDTTTVEWKDAKLHVGRVAVASGRKLMWIGNWCWDGCYVTPEDCARILVYLRDKRNARCIGGPCGMFERFETWIGEGAPRQSRGEARRGTITHRIPTS